MLRGARGPAPPVGGGAAVRESFPEREGPKRVGRGGRRGGAASRAAAAGAGGAARSAPPRGLLPRVPPPRGCRFWVPATPSVPGVLLPLSAPHLSPPAPPGRAVAPPRPTPRFPSPPLALRGEGPGARGCGAGGAGRGGWGSRGGVCVCVAGVVGRLGGASVGPPTGGGWPVASRLGPAGAGAVGVGRVWWRRRRLVAVSGRGSRSPPPVPRPVRSLSLPPFQVPSASRRGGLKTPRGPPVRPGSGAVGPLGGGGKCGEGWAGPAPAHLSHPSPRGLRLPRPRGGGRWEPPGRLWGVLLGGRPSGNHPVVKPSPTRPSLFLSAAGRPEAP